MSHRYLLILLGLLLIAFGLIERGWVLVAVWLGGDFLAVGIAHARRAHQIFGKQPDGTFPFWSWFVFLPLLLYTGFVWHLARLFSQEPRVNSVSEELVVGRRLLSHEVDGTFANYVDLTAEFPEQPAIRRSSSYLCFPILDGSAPDPKELLNAISQLRPGKTFIHCAQGHGRTGLFALALMLKSGVVQTIGEGLERLQAGRPRSNLSVF